jgi:hypothetical protein
LSMGSTALDLPPTRDEELIVQMSHMIRMIITGARTLAGHPPPPEPATAGSDAGQGSSAALPVGRPDWTGRHRRPWGRHTRPEPGRARPAQESRAAADIHTPADGPASSG